MNKKQIKKDPAILLVDGAIKPIVPSEPKEEGQKEGYRIIYDDGSVEFEENDTITLEDVERVLNEVMGNNTFIEVPPKEVYDVLVNNKIKDE